MFKNTRDITVHLKYYLRTVEIKDYNVIINGKSFFDQPVKSSIRTYDNIQNIATGRGDDYRIGCLLGYNYLNKHYKKIAMDLSKQQAPDANPKSIHQINFTGDLD